MLYNIPKDKFEKHNFIDETDKTLLKEHIISKANYRIPDVDINTE